MFYCKEVIVPAQTTPAEPYSDTLALTKGVITQVWVRWYYGSGNLCGVQLKIDEFARWPMTLGEWIPSSVYPLVIPENYPLSAAKAALKIVAFNTDDVYEHRLWVAVAVLRPKASGQLEDFLTWIAGQQGA